VIIFAWGLFNYFFPAGNREVINTSNVQRNLAIEEAKKNDKNTYQFETNFIPGIGTVNNPEAYKEKLKEDFESNTR